MAEGVWQPSGPNYLFKLTFLIEDLTGSAKTGLIGGSFWIEGLKKDLDAWWGLTEEKCLLSESCMQDSGNINHKNGFYWRISGYEI